MRGAGRHITRAIGLLGAGIVLLAGCAQRTEVSEPVYGPCGSTPEELVAAAKAEGAVNLIAVPREWAGSGEIIDLFEKTYGIAVTSSLPQLDSFGELTILRTWAGDPRFPDVVEMSPAAMSAAVGEGLIEPFRPPSAEGGAPQFRDPEGYWVAPYAGFLALAVNSARVKTPVTGWSDLRQPEFADTVVLRGDPRVSGVGTAAVTAVALAQGGSLDDVGPGIDYFADLWKRGNLRNGIATTNELRYGTAPVVIDWNYNIAAFNANLIDENAAYRLVYPDDGDCGMVYANGLTVGAPHPCAGRLWIDFLQTPQVGLLRAKAGAVPPMVARLYDDPSLSVRERELLPPPEALDRLTFPTSDQSDAIDAQINGQWAVKLPGWSPS